jgi:uncharacterized protein
MIGSAVFRALLLRGDQPVGLSRDPANAAAELQDAEWHTWTDPLTTQPPAEALSGADGIVHLLGEPVAQRWDAQAKKRIHDSRVLSTRNLVAALRTIADESRPRVIVSQSATGYYGPRQSEQIDEHTSAGEDFLAGVVSAWEQEALVAAGVCRVVLTRTGVVLAPRGGALAKMLPFFRAGVGGPVAGGRQFVPWIHIDDVVAALLFCLDTAEAEGPVNLTAPRPVDNAELSRAVGHALHRPAALPVPALALRLLYGDMSAIVTTGQRAVPQRLEQLGFTFRYPGLGPALSDVLS